MNSDPQMSSELEMLYWYRDSGVDIALEDAPINQFEQTRIEAEIKAEAREKSKRKAPERQPPTPRNAAPVVPDLVIPDEKVVTNARELASEAKTLVELRSLLEGFQGCNLRRGAKNLVFGDGDPTAKIMLVGEAPGFDEDMHGLPFVGRSGQLLDRMLRAIDIERKDVYIANVLPWRPPGNRTPTPQEIEICRPFIERQIALVNPEILVCLGGASAKTLLNTSESILRLRGSWKKYTITQNEESKQIDCLPTLHPAYLLRQPAQKKLAWQDLLKLKAKISA